LTITPENFKGYWYGDGYVRTSSKEYNLESPDKLVHLTNDCQ